MYRQLVQLVEGLGRPRLLVVGDLMLDRYVFGDAERISPEAPIQILRAGDAESRLGGAGSVVANLRALGARVSVFGVIGRDAAGAAVGRIGHGSNPTTCPSWRMGRRRQTAQYLSPLPYSTAACLR